MSRRDDPRPSPPGLELEQDDRFPSGKWVGFFLQPMIPGRHEMELILTFSKGTLDGEGRDKIGRFLIKGRYQVEDTQLFFKLYYAPNNATLVVAGDFQVAAARALIEQYFGEIARVQSPPKVQCEQPYNTGLIRRQVPDKNATLPAVVGFYRVPEDSHADHPALELLSTILGQGESSRLNRVLAREAKAAAAAQTLSLYGPTRGPNSFAVLAIANQGVSADSLEKLLAIEVAKLAIDGVTDAELRKAKNAYRASTITGRQRSLNVAEAVQYAAMFLGGADKVNSEIARYDAVTVADIKRVATKYLRPDNSLVLLIVPEAK